MIRTTIVVVLTLLANFTDASRVTHEEKSDLSLQFPRPFARSCEDLQGIFRSRVNAVQAILDTNHNATHVSSMTQARTIMRVFGVIRTFRRAKDCQWVINGSGEDVALARSVLQAVLAENPCAQAALAEMTPEAFETAENEMLPLQRAMIVMMSESCEVPEQEEEEVAVLEDEAAVERDLDEKETELQEHIDELFEQAALESETAAAGSFVQGASSFGFGYVLRVLGAVFMGLLLGLLCAPPAMFIGAFVGFFLCALIPGLCGRPQPGNAQVLNGFFIGGVLGGAAGFGVCAKGVITEFTSPASNGLGQ